MIKIKKVKEFKVPPPKYYNYKDLKIWYLPDYTSNLIKGVLVFDAGLKYTKSQLKNSLLPLMLLGSTKNYDWKKLKDTIDYYSAEISIYSDFLFSYIKFYVIKENYEKLVNLLLEILNNSIFSEEEFIAKKEQLKEIFLIKQKNSSFVADVNFLKNLFGNQIPYGSTIELKDFDNINVNELFELYNKLFTKERLRIYLAGNVDENILKISENFNNIKSANNNLENFNIEKIDELISKKNEKLIIYLEDAKQSSIRIGKFLPSIFNKDYTYIAFLSFILCGSFTSRLNLRIRESEGLTYDISSRIVALPEISFLKIKTECNLEQFNKVVKIIYEEIKKLSENKYSKKEIDLHIRSYITGFLELYDGVFTSLNTFIRLNELGLPYNYYETNAKIINTITEDILIETSQKYFNSNNYLEIIVTSKNN